MQWDVILTTSPNGNLFWPVSSRHHKFDIIWHESPISLIKLIKVRKCIKQPVSNTGISNAASVISGSHCYWPAPGTFYANKFRCDSQEISDGFLTKVSLIWPFMKIRLKDVPGVVPHNTKGEDVSPPPVVIIRTLHQYPKWENISPYMCSNGIPLGST